jgi:hypothetical protein
MEDDTPKTLQMAEAMKIQQHQQQEGGQEYTRSLLECANIILSK